MKRLFIILTLIFESIVLISCSKEEKKPENPEE